MLNYLNKISTKPLIYRTRQFATTTLLQAKGVDSKDGKEESARMKQFHKKMKLQPVPRVPSKKRFVDLVLVETDPNSGELITNSEKDPTKWGDWQNGGRILFVNKTAVCILSSFYALIRNFISTYWTVNAR